MKKQIFTGITVLFTAGLVHAKSKTLPFSSVWEKINAVSAAQESSRLQGESLTESRRRVSHHWLPKVYIDAKTYQTNDPGASFFGLLQQRSITGSDFNPDSINHPSAGLYTRGSLGIDLALYEGGMKSSQVELFRHSAAAQEKATSQIQIEQYSAVGSSYGSIAVLEVQKTRLLALSSEITRLIKGYQLGSRSNPVGYSGLLGMKSLANRISGLTNQYEAQSRAYYSALNEMGIKDPEWSPENIDANSFVRLYFSDPAGPTETLASYKVESAMENAKASEKMAKIEKAKFLPRVGAFAETYIFKGNRASANGYNAGLYLQWNLYDPAEFGSHKEVKLKSMATAKFAEASEQQERAERAAQVELIKSLRQNLSLIEDSYGLLLEQSKMTETLFKNGSINALQFVEVLSRRADLIIQHGEVELAMIKAGAQLITKQKFDIDVALNTRGKNENQ